MHPVKRFGLVAYLVVLGTVLAASPALARKPAVKLVPVSYTYRLTLPEIDPPEPRTSGQWTLDIWTLPTPSVDVKVSCRGLTPGRQYAVDYWVVWYPMFGDDFGDWMPLYFRCDTQFVAADAKGRLNAQFTVQVSEFDAVYVDSLWVENDEGDVVLEEL